MVWVKVAGRTAFYWVEPELMLCTCPDFVYRRHRAGELCRHLSLYVRDRPANE